MACSSSVSVGHLSAAHLKRWASVMHEPVSLEQLFCAFVNQGTLEEAAEMMVGLVESYPEMENEFIKVLQDGVNAASHAHEAVVSAVNKSGYRAATAQEAGEYCAELLRLFQEMRASKR